MEKKTLYLETLVAEQAETLACFSRFGYVVSATPNLAQVKVDFEGNPFGQPIMAKLSGRFTDQELVVAGKRRLKCYIEFANQDISLPVVTHIVFDLDHHTSDLAFSAKQIQLDVSHSIKINSGDALSTIDAHSGIVTTEGKHILSKAEMAQKLQAGVIKLN